MKKAIVIAITMILGLGLTAFAGPLSGSWESSLVVDPAASTFTSLSSTLAVDYTVSGWTFESSSSFTLTGFSSQSFTAGGSFGAFTLSSTMTFDPMAVIVEDYTAFWDAVTLAQIQTVSICPITCTTTTEPKFLKWQTEGSISIGGVEIGALFYIDQSNYDVTRINYLTNLAGDVQTTSYVCDSGVNGSGWRFKVAGSIGDITATSYTYFNLVEPDALTTYCPALGKRGTFTIAGADCDPSFYEEYILLEGIALGCATIDAALSIGCTGFNDISFVVNDVVIGEWLELDFGLKFELTAKSYDFCFTAVVPESDCFIIEFGFNDSANPTDSTAISSINFYGIGFIYAWEAITFTSYTELDLKSALFSGKTAYSYIYNDVTNSYLVPYTGRSDACAATATYFTVENGWYELNCVYTERYKLWEKFIIDIDGDACCGGALDLTISTWFGDHQVLDYVAYDVILDTKKAAGSMQYLYQLDDVLLSDTYSLATGTVTKTTAVTHDTVNYKTGYVDDTATTLFNWAKFAVDASVGVASNITLDLGFNVSAFGWESLGVGFTFIF